MSGANTAGMLQPTGRALPGKWAALDIPLCKSDVWAERKRSAKPSSGVECSHQSCVLSGLVERSAVWLAERSLRSEDGRTADTAGMGGWDLKVRTAAVESTVG